jgi:surfactin synthase thioesterase subunit
MLLGCCSGAVLGLEAARSLHELAPGLLAGLVVASRSAPHLPVPGLAELSGTVDARIVDRLTELGGFAPAVLASPQLLEVVLPTVLGDFRAQEGYLAEPWALPIPLLTIAGEDDDDCSPEQMAGWCEYGNPVAHARIAGGHFLVMENPAGLLAAMTQQLSLFEASPGTTKGPA